MLHVVNKPIGATPLDMIVKLRETDPTLFDVPMTYAGRLDPMAEGVVLILSGDDRHKKSEFEKLTKVYRATILFGFTSDTHDALGMPQATGITPVVEEVATAIHNLLGDHTLPFPAYSARKVGGKPLHHYANTGSLGDVTIPTTTMSVALIEDIRCDQVSPAHLLTDITQCIARVRGDFRQVAITQAWQNLLNAPEAPDVLTAEVTLRVSSGTYIRSLAKLLGERLGSGALLLHLVRTQVGDHALENAEM
ncbi:hypothetical protein KBC55_01625 [Patescibacteria group bacterium]|nr:hypothetical protein [Patescibacteria group bacterium]